MDFVHVSKCHKKKKENFMFLLLLKANIMACFTHRKINRIVPKISVFWGAIMIVNCIGITIICGNFFRVQ